MVKLLPMPLGAQAEVKADLRVTAGTGVLLNWVPPAFGREVLAEEAERRGRRGVAELVGVEVG
jgi:hypothetical protein